MSHFCTKPIFVWVWIILITSCQPKSSELIDFGVSEGVMNNMDFSPFGYQQGQKIGPIQLHSLNGDLFQVKPKGNKRPILLISGSYTCDKTRGKLSAIDQLHEKFKGGIDIYLVNTLEAHPQSSQSPYSAEPVPWHAENNLKSGISAEQPRTMNERQNLAQLWIKEQNIQTPVLLDGLKNEFWNQTGQAPNMSILISGEGEVVLKQAWFEEKELEEAILGEL